MTQKNLWTPWRMEHVLGQTKKISGCLFEPPGDDSSNAEFLLLYRDNMRLVLLNRFPYANGHLLIADHLHFHVVPRWQGDHNFMTITADIRTIPEHINNTFSQLEPDFQQLLPKGGSNGI